MTNVFADRLIEPTRKPTGRPVQLSVKYASEKKQNSNLLLRSLIVVSLIVHAFILMHIAGIYKSKALTYIELTMQDMSGLTARDIPRPRVRTKTPQPRDVKRLAIPRQMMPNLKVEPVEKDLPDSLAEGISIPDITDADGMQVGDWRSAALAASRDYVTSNDYYEMVRLKIENQKKYPEIARNSRIQGYVTVCFVITADGSVKEVEVLKTSKYKILDVAALKAVQDAAPFQRPPKRFFKGPVSMELIIAFEII